jgi:hypothetical protein
LQHLPKKEHQRDLINVIGSCGRFIRSSVVVVFGVGEHGQPFDAAFETFRMLSIKTIQPSDLDYSHGLEQQEERTIDEIKSTTRASIMMVRMTINLKLERKWQFHLPLQ